MATIEITGEVVEKGCLSELVKDDLDAAPEGETLKSQAVRINEPDGGWSIVVIHSDDLNIGSEATVLGEMIYLDTWDAAGFPIGDWAIANVTSVIVH